MPFAFDISMGVRATDAAFRSELDGILTRRRQDIRKILDEYGIPVAGPGTAPSSRTDRR
jgi:hypothetical protein